MTYKTLSIQPALHLLHSLLRPRANPQLGTLSPQDLRRIVAEMVG